jgi:hypothetical protein
MKSQKSKLITSNICLTSAYKKKKKKKSLENNTLFLV